MLSMKGGRALHWWNKVTGKEKVNCQSVHECVYACVEYYNLTPECEDTHATSTAIKVLQSLEEHFVTACTLVKPHR